MSPPPKEPKPEDAARRAAGPALEHTFLGVAPAAPEAPSPAGSGGSVAGGSVAGGPVAGGPVVGGSAIVAAPMISVSGDRAQRPPAAPVAPAAPIARTSLQGGWQSAGVPRPALQDQTALQGTPATPAGWVPPAPVVTPPVPVVAPPVPVGAPIAPRPAAQPPRPSPQAQGPRPGATPSPPAAGAGLQHTALASDYLRAARELALGAAVPVPTPHAPAAGTGSAGRSLQQQTFAPNVPARGQEPARATLDIPVNLAESFIAVAPPTVGPPATAELSEPGPLPVHAPAPAAMFAPEPEPLLNGPRSIGTQASVAPPPSDLAAPVVNPAARAPVGGAVAAAASPVRNLQPHAQPMTGTMLERAPSVPGSGLPHSPAPGSGVASSAPVGSATRFEQVPSARGSLQATGFGLQIPIDHGANDWSRVGLAAAGGSAKPKQQPPSQLRLLLLAALAVAAIGFAAFGKQLVRARQSSPTDGIGPSTASQETVTPEQATLTNLPSTPAAPAAAVPAPVPAPGAPPTVSSPTAEALPAAAASPPVTRSETLDRTAAKATAAAGKAAEASASPESRLAAQAGRHVLAARYADALPLYRELQRSYPQNTAYAAMTHVLEQKTAAGKPAAQPAGLAQ